jgi:hypothetical protein
LYPITARHDCDAAVATLEALREWWRGDTPTDHALRNERFDWVCFIRVPQSNESVRRALLQGRAVNLAHTDASVDMLHAMNAARQRAYVALYASETLEMPDDDGAAVVIVARVVVLACYASDRLVRTIRDCIDHVTNNATPRATTEWLNHRERSTFKNIVRRSNGLPLKQPHTTPTLPTRSVLHKAVPSELTRRRDAPLLVPTGEDITMTTADTIPAIMMRHMYNALRTLTSANDSLAQASTHVNNALTAVSYNFSQCAAMALFLAFLGTQPHAMASLSRCGHGGDKALTPTSTKARRLLALLLRSYCAGCYRFEADAARALHTSAQAVPSLRCYARPSLEITRPEPSPNRMTPTTSGNTSMSSSTAELVEENVQTSVSASFTDTWRVTDERAKPLRRAADSQLVSVHVRKRQQLLFDVPHVVATQVALYGTVRSHCEALRFGIGTYAIARCDAIEQVLFRMLRSGATCFQLACAHDRPTRVHALMSGTNAEHALTRIAARAIEYARTFDAHFEARTLIYAVGSTHTALVMPNMVFNTAQVARRMVIAWWREECAQDETLTRDGVALQTLRIDDEALFDWPLGNSTTMLRCSALADRMVHAPRGSGKLHTTNDDDIITTTTTAAVERTLEFTLQSDNSMALTDSVLNNDWIVRAGGLALHSLLSQHAHSWPQDSEPRLLFAVSPILHGISSPLMDDDVGVTHSDNRALLTWRALHVPLYWQWMNRALAVCELRYVEPNSERASYAQACLQWMDRWLCQSVRDWAIVVRHSTQSMESSNPTAISMAAPAPRRYNTDGGGGGGGGASKSEKFHPNRSENNIRLHDGTTWDPALNCYELAVKYKIDPLFVQVVSLLAAIRDVYALPYKLWIDVGIALHTIQPSAAMEQVYRWWSKRYGAAKYKEIDWTSEAGGGGGGVRWRSFRVRRGARSALCDLMNHAVKVTPDRQQRIAIAEPALIEYLDWVKHQQADE